MSRTRAEYAGLRRFLSCGSVRSFPFLVEYHRSSILYPRDSMIGDGRLAGLEEPPAEHLDIRTGHAREVARSPSMNVPHDRIIQILPVVPLEAIQDLTRICHHVSKQSSGISSFLRCRQKAHSEMPTESRMNACANASCRMESYLPEPPPCPCFRFVTSRSRLSSVFSSRSLATILIGSQ